MQVRPRRKACNDRSVAVTLDFSRLKTDRTKKTQHAQLNHTGSSVTRDTRKSNPGTLGRQRRDYGLSSDAASTKTDEAPALRKRMGCRARLPDTTDVYKKRGLLLPLLRTLQRYQNRRAAGGGGLAKCARVSGVHNRPTRSVAPRRWLNVSECRARSVFIVARLRGPVKCT